MKFLLFTLFMLFLSVMRTAKTSHPHNDENTTIDEGSNDDFPIY